MRLACEVPFSKILFALKVLQGDVTCFQAHLLKVPKHPETRHLARPLKAAHWSCAWCPHCIDQSPSKQCVPPPFSRYSICFSRFLVTASHNNMDATANAKICETKFPTTQLWHGDLLDFLDLFDVLWLDWDLSRDSNIQSFTVFQRFWCVSIKTVAGSNKNRWGALRCCHFFIVSQFQQGEAGSEYLSTSFPMYF